MQQEFIHPRDEKRNIPLSQAERKALAQIWNLSNHFNAIIEDAAWSYNSHDKAWRKHYEMSLEVLFFANELFHGGFIGELNDTAKVVDGYSSFALRIPHILKEKSASLGDIEDILRDLGYIDPANQKTMDSVARDFDNYIKRMQPLTEQDIDRAMQQHEGRTLLRREIYVSALAGIKDALIPEMQEKFTAYEEMRDRWYAAFCEAHPDLVERFKPSATPATHQITSSAHGGKLPEDAKQAPNIY